MDIGGYNELDLPDAGTQLHPSATALQSARACLYVYLRAARPNRVHLPDFICDSIFPSIDCLGIDRKFYSLNRDMLPVAGASVQSGDLLLVVDYFGLMSRRIRDFAASCDRHALIIDNSQALFSNPIAGFPSIYSPRKFLGIPDGGYLYSNVTADAPTERFAGEQHMVHLVLRASGQTRSGYSYFVEAEKALADIEPKRMSEVSRRLVRSISTDRVMDRRRQNFFRLHSNFADDNVLDLSPSDEVPLCYPLMLDRDVAELIEVLVNQGIFLPRYWPNCLDTDLCSMSRALVHKTLYLPINQSLGPADMDRLIREVQRVL